MIVAQIPRSVEKTNIKNIALIHFVKKYLKKQKGKKQFKLVL